MKKAILFILLVGLLSFPSTGFSESGFGIYGGIFMPQGDMDDLGYDAGFSGGLQWFSPLAEGSAFRYGFSAGFGRSSGDTEIYGVDIQEDVTIIDVLANCRYYISPNTSTSLFFQAGAGLGVINIDVEGSYFGYTASASESETKFGYALGGGLKFSQLETVMLYKSFSDADYITLTLGYNF
jgi:opacity protein-like surface antigen